MALFSISLLLWAGMQTGQHLRPSRRGGTGTAGPLCHAGSSPLSILGFPFLGNEARAVWGASVSPRPGPGSVSSFKLTCIFWLFLCIGFFSARGHFEFHLTLKEKEKQSSFNAAVITRYFFFHFLLFQPHSKNQSSSLLQLQLTPALITCVKMIYLKSLLQGNHPHQALH